MSITTFLSVIGRMMTIKAGLISLICFLGLISADWDCRTVPAGSHYDSWLPFHGFHQQTMKSQILMKPNTASYLIASSDPQGHRCMSSWNKLFGGSRCGKYHMHHLDSDRFVWRRSQECLIYSGGYIVGQKSDCPQANLIEIGAYAYDLGNEPFKNASLFQEFSTRLQIDQTYGIQIEFLQSSSIYTLYNATGAFLERQTIAHTPCSDYNQGYNLELYFGGVCPAPQDVTVCYQDT